MKTSKALLLTLIAGILFAFTSCSPYPEGPDFSLASKEARISGVWEIATATDTAGNDVSETYADWRYTFSEDGTALLSRSELAAGSTKITLEYTGIWALSEDETEFTVDANAEIISGVFVEIHREFLIRRLTKKEFWLTNKNEALEKFDMTPF